MSLTTDRPLISNPEGSVERRAGADALLLPRHREFPSRWSGLARILSGMSPREPLSLADVLTEVNDLLFLIERLNTRMVGNDVEIRRAIELKLRQARGRLADLLVERTASTTEADDRP